MTPGVLCIGTLGPKHRSRLQLDTPTATYPKYVQRVHFPERCRQFFCFRNQVERHENTFNFISMFFSPGTTNYFQGHLTDISAKTKKVLAVTAVCFTINLQRGDDSLLASDFVLKIQKNKTLEYFDPTNVSFDCKSKHVRG